MHCLPLLLLCFLLPLQATAQSRWMTTLNDTLPITSLSIPGAHDAATSSIHGRGRCQVLTIAEQLQAGVRAFDLRPTQRRRLTFGGFRTNGLGNIHHGLKSTGISLEDVFSDFNTFLEANPGEFVIVLLRDESDGRYPFKKPAQETFTTAIREFLQTQPKIVDFRADLRLRDCRGGILVLCRTGAPTNRVSTYLTWNHSVEGSYDRRIYYAADTFAPLAVQDCYSPSSANCSAEEFPARKLAAAKSFLNFAATKREFWVINHASAYIGTNNYCRSAERVNSDLSHYISGNRIHSTSETPKPAGPTGIIMMDFAGVEQVKFRGRTYHVSGKSLLRAVINNNCSLGGIQAWAE